MKTTLLPCTHCGLGATSDKRQMKEIGEQEIETPICLICWSVKAMEILKSKTGGLNPPLCHYCKEPMALTITCIDTRNSVATYAPIWRCSDGKTTLAFGTTSQRFRRLPSSRLFYLVITLVIAAICGTTAYLVQESYPDPPKVFTGEFREEEVCEHDRRCSAITVPVYRTVDVGYPMWVWALKTVAFFCFWIAIGLGITAIVQANSLWRVWKNMATG